MNRWYVKMTNIFKTTVLRMCEFTVRFRVQKASLQSKGRKMECQKVVGDGSGKKFKYAEYKTEDVSVGDKLNTLFYYQIKCWAETPCEKNHRDVM